MYTNSGGISINKIGTPIVRRYMTLCTYVHSFYVLWSIRYFFDKLVCFLKLKGVKMKYSILKYVFLFVFYGDTGSESTVYRIRQRITNL